MSSQWFKQSLVELIQALNRNEVCFETIIDSFYERIADRDPSVKAWQILIPKHEYLQQYYSNQAFYQTSILKGLPFAVKDVIDTLGIETSMGSDMYTNRIPTMDAAVVTAIKNAGGILIGKTVTTAFAFFKPGKTRNPHDLNRTPGGSSSGSAAAVADFMVPFALGTQTAASVIRPASYCGCIAYVASHQEFSLRNIQPLAQSLDSLGLFAQDFSDLILMRKVMRLDFEDIQLQPELNIALTLKVAMFSGNSLGAIQEEMYSAFQQYISSLKDHSIDVIEIPSDLNLNALELHHKKIMAYEVARNLRFEYQTGQMDEFLTELIQEGLKINAADYLQSIQAVHDIHDQLMRWQQGEGISFIIAPAAPGAAPIGLEKTGLPFMSRPWQVMGLPVTTFPINDDQKLPLGVQIIGQSHQDDALLHVSKFLFTLVKDGYV